MLLLLTLNLIAYPLFTTLASDAVEGRWLFSIAMEDGSKLPVFIAEFSQGQGRLISSSAEVELSIPSVAIEDNRLRLEIVSQRGTLSFDGELKNPDLLLGKVNGDGLSDREFSAERTELDTLGRVAPPSREERTDYSKAAALPDPSERIAALKAFLRKHSQSGLKEPALRLILLAHLEAKSQDELVLGAADAYGIAARDKFAALEEVAGLLADHGRLFGFAEKLADGLLLKSPEEPGYLRTRGRVAFRKGELEVATAFLRRAIERGPDDQEANTLLAEALTAQGKIAEAEEAYLRAYVSGDPSARRRLQDLYRSRTGSLQGLHARVDAEYRKGLPVVQTAKRSGPQPKRVVLFELFTGSECLPCQASDHAYDALLRYFPSSDLAAIQYHLHIPMPDPLTNPDAVQRAAYYQLHSTPAGLAGGSHRRMGGGGKTQAGLFFDSYRSLVEKTLHSPSPVSLKVRGTRQDNILRYQAQAVRTGDLPAEELRLRLALVEGTAHYTGRNGLHFHHNVMRKMLPHPQGVPIEREAEALAEIRGELDLDQLEKELEGYLRDYQLQHKVQFSEAPPAINRSDLHLVVFLQNEKTHEVLDSAIIEVED